MIWERWSRQELKAEKRESAAATVDILPALKCNRQHPGRVAIFWKQLETAYAMRNAARQESRTGLPCGNWEEFPGCTTPNGSAPRCTSIAMKEVGKVRQPIWTSREIWETSFSSQLSWFAQIKCMAGSPA